MDRASSVTSRSRCDHLTKSKRQLLQQNRSYHISICMIVARYSIEVDRAREQAASLESLPIYLYTHSSAALRTSARGIGAGLRARRRRAWALQIGVRGSAAVRRLAIPVALCDGHEVFFLAASGQIDPHDRQQLALHPEKAAIRPCTVCKAGTSHPDRAGCSQSGYPTFLRSAINH
jgi:hypothetical protein